MTTQSDKSCIIAEQLSNESDESEIEDDENSENGTNLKNKVKSSNTVISISLVFIGECNCFVLLLNRINNLRTQKHRRKCKQRNWMG